MKKLFSLLIAIVLCSGTGRALDLSWTASQFMGGTLVGYDGSNVVYYYNWGSGNPYTSIVVCFVTANGVSVTANNKTFLFPPAGTYQISASEAAGKVGRYQTANTYAWVYNNSRYCSFYNNGSGTQYKYYTGNIVFEEGNDGPYVHGSGLQFANNAFNQVMNGTHSVTCGTAATYYNVTVQANNNSYGTATPSYKSGYVYANNRSREYKKNSVYTITATPNSGYRFVRWEKNGSQISTDATTDVVINGDATYTAIFESNSAPQYTITTAVSPSNTYGTVTGAGTYYENDPATLTATSANEHLYIFDHWLKDGNNYAGGTTITPTVTANATYTAVFRAAAAGTITGVADHGTISGTGNYAGGTAVSLSVTPATGYMFSQWSDGNTDNPRTVYVDGNATYTAEFIDLSVPVLGAYSYDNSKHHIEWGKWGYSNPNNSYVAFWDDFNDPQHSEFLRLQIWDETVLDGNNNATTYNNLQLCFWVSDFSNTYAGTMAPKEGVYIVTEPEIRYDAATAMQYGYEGNNLWGYDESSETYLDKVIIGCDPNKAIADSYWRTDLGKLWTTAQSPYVAYFSKKNLSYGSPYDFYTITNGTTVKVERGKDDKAYVVATLPNGRVLFTVGEPAPATHALAWDANGGELSGTYTAAGDYEEGAAITAPTATKTGYHLTGWSPAFTGTMPASDVTYVAQWTANTYNVSFAPNGGSGTMTDQVFTYGVAQNLKANTFTAPTATATYNYNGATGGNTPASVTVTATADGWFEGNNYYEEGQSVNNLTATNGATVAMTANWGWTEEITLPTPTKTGYEFDQWSFNMGGMDLMEDAGAEIPIEEDVTMTAQWNIVTYNLTYEGLEGATNNTNPDTYNVESETITLAAPGARDGYAFTGWTINGTPVTEITHGSTGDKTITANWNAKLSVITLEDNRENSFYNTFKTTYDGATGLVVTYKRQFTQGRWSTLCLPFDVNSTMFSSLKFGSRIYEFKYATGNADDDSGVNLYFSIAKSIKAGKGYIVNADAKLAARTSFEFLGVNIDLSADNGAELNSVEAYDNLTGSSSEGNIELVGTLRKGTLKGTATGNRYMGLKDNKIYYPNITTGSTILAYRGIFRSIKETLNAERIRIIVDGEEKAELEVINGELQEVQETKKFIENGVLYIERNGVIYDATGRKVE